VKAEKYTRLEISLTDR